MTTHVEKSYVAIRYNETSHSIEIDWKTSPTSVEFREGMNQGIEAMKKYQTGALLSDTTNLGALSEEDQQWSYTEWLQRAMAVGYHSFAVVVSSDIFAQMSVEDTLSQVQGVTIQYFDTVDEAQSWLQENNKATKNSVSA